MRAKVVGNGQSYYFCSRKFLIVLDLQTVLHISSDNLGQRVVDKLPKLSKTDYSMGCFTADFCEILPKTSKFGFWVVGWIIVIKSNHFRDFLVISWFPKILSPKLFDSSWGSSYIYFLVLKFSSVSLVVKRNCAKIRKSLQMLFPRL